MATEATPESAEEKPTPTIFDHATTYDHPQILGQTAKPWLDEAIDQARLYQKAVQETLDSTIEASRSRISRILSTSSAHFNQALDSLEDVKSEISAYEGLVFAKIKGLLELGL